MTAIQLAGDCEIDTTRPHVAGCPRALIGSAECFCLPDRSGLDPAHFPTFTAERKKSILLDLASDLARATFTRGRR